VDDRKRELKKGGFTQKGGKSLVGEGGIVGKGKDSAFSVCDPKKIWVPLALSTGGGGTLLSIRKEKPWRKRRASGGGSIWTENIKKRGRVSA